MDPWQAVKEERGEAFRGASAALRARTQAHARERDWRHSQEGEEKEQRLGKAARRPAGQPSDQLPRLFSPPRKGARPIHAADGLRKPGPELRLSFVDSAPPCRQKRAEQPGT